MKGVCLGRVKLRVGQKKKGLGLSAVGPVNKARKWEFELNGIKSSLATTRESLAGLGKLVNFLPSHIGTCSSDVHTTIKDKVVGRVAVFFAKGNDRHVLYGDGTNAIKKIKEMRCMQ